MKRIVFWILIPIALFAVLVVTLYGFATRIINQESVKNNIEAAVSQELGGKFSYERVNLSVLPRLRVVIQGLNVSIPKSLSGSMKTLNIYPELWPLITGKLRFTQVMLDHPNVHVSLLGKTSDRAAQETRPILTPEQNLATVLGFVASRMPTVSIFIKQGQLTFDQTDQRLFSLQEVESRIAFSPTESDAEGSSAVPPGQRFKIIGNVKGIVAAGDRFPGLVHVTVKQFEIIPQKILISDSRIELLDAKFSVSGSMDGYLAATPKADLLIVAGTVGPETVQWVRTAGSLPPELVVQAPVTFSRVHMFWSTKGTRLEGSASVQDGLNFLFDVAWGPDRFVVKNLRIRDQTSQATLAFDLEQRAVLNLSFSGNLTQTTLSRLFKQERFQFGWIRGDLRARVVLDRPRESTATGTLEGEEVVFPFQLKVPVLLNRVSLHATDQTVILDSVVLSLGSTHHTVKGKITASADGWLIDMDSDGLDWESLQPLFASDTTHDQSAAQAQKREPVNATIRLSAASFSIGRWIAAPARAEIISRADGIRISLKEAVVCGVNLPGMVTITPTEMSLDLRLSASHQDLKSSSTCLSGEERRITGTFDLSGHLNATGIGQTLLNTLQGSIAFSAKDGRMFNNSIAVRILTFLNVTDLLRGNYPNPGIEGVPYKSLLVRGTIQKGVVSFDEAVLTSPSVHLAGRGSMKLLDRTMDVTVLVAPFTTTDAMVKRIPLVRDILGNSLVTIPIRISGPIDDPKVESIPPSAVANGLVGMMNRTLGLPFKMMEPNRSDEKTP